MKPTPAEVETALAAARHLRESGQDEHFLARTLLNHHHRLQLLDDVYRATASYLHGESAQQHARLVKALEAYRRYDEAAG
ncbi:MAG: hypothetical protein ACOY3X_05665 [Pseudomonadota bacterium]